MNNVSVYDKMTNAEREVALLLKEFGIKWSYEHPVFVWDENNRPRVWAPDFYLINFGIYIEVCGSSSYNYEYRKKILDRNGVRVIFLHLYENRKKWRYHLICYLEKIMGYRNKKLEEILEYIN